MIEWLWRRLADRVEARITNRLLDFHQAMVERRELPEIGGDAPACLAALPHVAATGVVRIREVGEKISLFR
jgi:hypothetical protein